MRKLVPSLRQIRVTFLCLLGISAVVVSPSLMGQGKVTIGNDINSLVMLRYSYICNGGNTTWTSAPFWAAAPIPEPSTSSLLGLATALSLLRLRPISAHARVPDADC